jgi:hypothetical protein
MAQGHRIAMYEGYSTPPAEFGAYRRRRRRTGGRGKRNCRFGVVRRGRRRGQCLKNKRRRR